MSQGLRMVHLRTVPDAWQARVLAARLGSEGIVTHLQGGWAGPYPFGAVSVLVESGQADLAAELLLADEVEAAFAGQRSVGAGRGGQGRRLRRTISPRCTPARTPPTICCPPSGAPVAGDAPSRLWPPSLWPAHPCWPTSSASNQ